MKLWTLQPLRILDEIEREGTFRCRKELSFNLSKKDSLEDKYRWLMEKMEERIGEKPEGVEYPVWAWHTWEGERRCPDVHSAAFLRRTEDKVLLTLEIPDKEVLLTDFDAWQVVLNGWYLNRETRAERLEKLEAYLDSLKEDELTEAVRDSWEKVFDIERCSGDGFEQGYFIQATFWEIKREYITEQRIIPKEDK